MVATLEPVTKLYYKLVRTAEEREIVRRTRNACAGQYAHHNLEITQTQNEEYWRLHGSYIRAWIAYLKNGQVVGVCSLRGDGSGYVQSFIAVNPIYRGLGYAKELLQYVVAAAEDDVVKGSVVTTNIPLLKVLARMGGWKITGYEELKQLLFIEWKNENSSSS